MYSICYLFIRYFEILLLEVLKQFLHLLVINAAPADTLPGLMYMVLLHPNEAEQLLEGEIRLDHHDDAIERQLHFSLSFIDLDLEGVHLIVVLGLFLEF